MCKSGIKIILNNNKQPHSNVVNPLLCDVLAELEKESWYNDAGLDVILVDDVREIVSKYFI